MKTVRIFIWISAISLLLVGCKKENDDFVQVSVFEKALHDEVNAYRASKGLNELVLQFIMVKEAKEHANGRANGSISDEDAAGDINERWYTIEGKLGVNNISNEAYITSQITTQTAAEVVAAWASDSIGRLILEADYTQSGPGTGMTSDGRTYILHLFCKYTE